MNKFDDRLIIEMKFAETYVWIKVIAYENKVKSTSRKSYNNIDVLKVWINSLNHANIQ